MSYQLSDPGFVASEMLAAVVPLILIVVVGPLQEQTKVFIYLTMCSVMGAGFQSPVLKTWTLLLKSLFKLVIKHPSPLAWILLPNHVVCVCTQSNYLNRNPRHMQHFFYDSNVFLSVLVQLFFLRNCNMCLLMIFVIFWELPYSHGGKTLLHTLKGVSFGLANLPLSFQKDVKALNINLSDTYFYNNEAYSLLNQSLKTASLNVL